MNILFIHQNFPGQFKFLAPALAEAGHHVRALTINGGAGNDILFGGAGLDTMTGGTGANTFSFSATSNSTLALSDVISDFGLGTNIINLSAIDANTGVGGNQAFLFVAVATPSTVANSVTWSEDIVNNITILHIDNTGDITADMQIVLQGTGLGLTAADFIL